MVPWAGEIARATPDETEGKYPPEKIVEIAKKKKSDMIAYTYTEPTIFYEYGFDTCKLYYIYTSHFPIPI